jgi:beta-N-acetylhexosaminidase
MKYIFILIFTLFLSVSISAQSKQYSLADFYEYDAILEFKTDSIFDKLTEKQQVAQMLVASAGELGYPESKVKQLVKDNLIGGIVFLKGTRANHKRMVDELNEISNQNNSIPLIYSIDAEPSLYNGRIKGTPKMMKTIQIQTKEASDSVAKVISEELKRLGMHQNFAPVVDVSPNNAAIKNRSYGNDAKKVVELSDAFIQSSQRNGIVATAKHFPGHGLVTGDTHKQTVFIDGKLQELQNYPPLIASGIISVMVAHITIKNNEKYGTDGTPATLSRKIVTGLLRKELDFRGIIITDALNNMKAVSTLENATLKASMAGNDMLLMPKNERKDVEVMVSEMKKNEAYKQQVEQSVKRIIRLKICLGIL